MSEPIDLHDPWLVAVWPGMGSVALGAGNYLIEQLSAQWLTELDVQDLFEIQHVEVDKGLSSAGKLPRCMFFFWQDPAGKHDLLIFIGEAQPASGGLSLCEKVLDFAARHGVKRFYTFAAMSTQLHPSGEPRVFGAATARKLLAPLRRRKVEILASGQIGGLNGVLLAAGARRKVDGVCLLGEMPYFAAGVPNPKASQAVLEVFCDVAGIDLDFTSLAQQAEEVNRRLTELLNKANRAAGQPTEDAEDFTVPSFADDDEAQTKGEPDLDAQVRQRIDNLFNQARRDRGKALQLKQELDRLGLFKCFEDRFLDLFRKTE